MVEQHPCWVTLVRRRQTDEQRLEDSFGEAWLLLPPAFHMGHNAALACVNEQLHVFGGQHQLLGRSGSTEQHGTRWPQPGVLHSRQMRKHGPFTPPRLLFGRAKLSASAGLDPSTSAMVPPPCLVPLSVFAHPEIGGRTPLCAVAMRCIEYRSTVHAGSGTCQMDGKLSAVQFRGDVWLFARANMARTGGARHVQAAHSLTDPSLQSWSNWSALRFDGVSNHDHTASSEARAITAYNNICGCCGTPTTTRPAPNPQALAEIAPSYTPCHELSCQCREASYIY